MGCINSTNKHIYALKRDDIFNASVVRVQTEQPVVLARQGFFEITSQELIYTSSDQDQISWALQHLRRYGLTGNIFSFEAGRRCRAGPGIYTFRCCNADQFYEKFQRCINSVPAFGDRGNNAIHSSNLFVRLDTHLQNTNHYLEPTNVQLSSSANERTLLTESVGYDSNDFNLNSPDSVQSASLTTEIINFRSTVAYSNISPNRNLFVSGSNIYLEQPIRPYQEYNNNISAQEESKLLSSDKNALNVMNLVKSSSLDMPPEECAPIIAASGIDSQRVYANIDPTASMTTSQSLCINLTDPCYANVEVSARLENTIASSTHSKPFQMELVNEQLPKSIFAPPVVNYIVLDLDQPRSPSQCSPQNDGGSSHSLSVSSENMYNIKREDISSNTASISCGSSTIPKGSTIQNNHEAISKNMESSGSYTRIDFLKTFALMKSSTNYTDFELDNEQEESRITRHSKFIRKAYSISE